MIELLGTAHVSGRSVEKVEQRIREMEPDAVAVELDPGRYQKLTQGTEEIDLRSMLKGNVFLSLLTWMLSFLQSRIGADLGVKPGEDMKRAVEVADELDIPIVLIDRDISVTMNRLWSTMGLWEKLKMAGSLGAGLLGFGDTEEVDIDALGEGENVDELMAELRRYAPSLARVLIDERDSYMANALLNQRDRGEVLAVVGAGHVDGIRSYLDDPATLPDARNLVEVKEKRISLGKVAGAAITLGIIGLLVKIFMGQPLHVIVDALIYWFLVNGFLSAVAVLLVRGHPFSAVTAFGTAWLTSLTIFLAAGWFAGVSEAYVRKPQPADLDSLMDAATFRDLLSNDLFKVVLVAAAANVGSIVGTAIGGVYLARVAGLPI